MAARSRRKAREVALQVLYEIELGHGKASEAIDALSEEVTMADDLMEYTRLLVFGVRTKIHEIDGYISPLLRDYGLDRTLPVDRNVLRIATYELYFVDDVPPAVTINEAIEIAKKFSTVESGKFINGVLGNLLHQSPKANWIAPIVVETSDFEPAEPIEVEEIEIEPAEAEKVKRLGAWTVRTEF